MKISFLMYLLFSAFNKLCVCFDLTLEDEDTLTKMVYDSYCPIMVIVSLIADIKADIII